MIRKILLATDGSEHAKKALAYACDLALKYGATLHLLHVVSPPPALFHEAAFAMPDIQRALEDEGKKIIDDVEAEAKKSGVQAIRSTLVQGNPASEIIRFAEAEGVDMIVMGSRGLNAVKEFVLGSVSHRVTHSALCTVTIVK